MAKALTSKKAKQILKDNSANGNPLTKKQKGFFGAVAGGSSSKNPYAKAKKAIERKSKKDSVMGG